MGMQISTQRKITLLIVVISSALTGASFYFDKVMNLEPCHLCLLQRFAVIALAVIALLATLHNPKTWAKHLYSGGLILFSGFGLVMAIRQVWLQQQPPDTLAAMACAPGLDYMLANMPFTEIIKSLFTATAECGEVNWTFLSLSMAGWMVIWFSLLFSLSLSMLIRRGNNTTMN